jgi:hypothetical protein
MILILGADIPPAFGLGNYILQLENLACCLVTSNLPSSIGYGRLHSTKVVLTFESLAVVRI